MGNRKSRLCAIRELVKSGLLDDGEVGKEVLELVNGLELWSEFEERLLIGIGEALQDKVDAAEFVDVDEAWFGEGGLGGFEADNVLGEEGEDGDGKGVLGEVLVIGFSIFGKIHARFE